MNEKERIVNKIKKAQNGDAYRQAKEAFKLLRETREFLQTLYDAEIMIDMDDEVETLCRLMVEIDNFLPKN